MHLNIVHSPPKTIWGLVLRSFCSYIAALTIITLSPLPTQAQSAKETIDLAAFKSPGGSWQTAASVRASLEEDQEFIISSGKGILVNQPSRKNPGKNLVSIAEYGDVTIELDYMLAKGGNSGIYLQGRYEIQLLDSWNVRRPTFGDNGGIYQRWDDSRPEGMKGYDGHAPRLNASLAPGLWQHLEIAFRAPKFDASGNKIANALIEKVVLNGVLIQENVQLTGPTRSPVSEEESARGPLLIQGDHGAVAFRNIQIRSNEQPGGQQTAERELPDPIFVQAKVNTSLRSFMDIPGNERIVHNISVGSPQKIHYSYDLDQGALYQVWRGGFLDATPMWHNRGDGSSRPRGALVFLGDPLPAIAPLASTDESWPSDTSNFRQMGYQLDQENRPIFIYSAFGAEVQDASQALENGRGLKRTISISGAKAPLYHLLARDEQIQQIDKETYLIGDNAWYVQILNSSGAKPILREKEGEKELILPVNQHISYSILF